MPTVVSLAKPSFPRLQRGHPLAKGLVGAWLFSEGKGLLINDAADCHAQADSRATILNPPYVYWDKGQFGNCLYFEGQLSRATVRCNTNFKDRLADFTVVTWFWPFATNGAAARIADKQYDTGFWVGTDATASDTGNWGGGIMHIVPPYGLYVSLSSNNWHQLVLSRKGGTATAIGDGGKVSSSVACSTAITDATALIFGQDTTVVSAGNLRLDSFLLYNRALSDQEIRNLYVDPYAMFRRRHVLKKTGSAPQTIGPPFFRKAAGARITQP